MPKIEIDRDRCKGCLLCMEHCSNKCIVEDTSLNKIGIHPALFLDKDKKCTGCSFCAVICPDVCVGVYR